MFQYLVGCIRYFLRCGFNDMQSVVWHQRVEVVALSALVRKLKHRIKTTAPSWLQRMKVRPKRWLIISLGPDGDIKPVSRRPFVAVGHRDHNHLFGGKRNLRSQQPCLLKVQTGPMLKLLESLPLQFVHRIGKATSTSFP